MKSFTLILIVVVVVCTLAAAKRIRRPEDCPFCSTIDGVLNQHCVCAESKRTERVVTCGVGCFFKAYCCESIDCPVCQAGVNPTPDKNCECDDSSSRRAMLYSCGFWCTAEGYCCGKPSALT